MSCNIIEVGGKINNSFNRNYYINKSELNEAIKRFDGDTYMTIYSYESEDIATTNYVAPFYLDLDIDDIENNYDKLLIDLKIVYKKLCDTFKIDRSDIQLYFSGSKGFHILISDKIFGFEPNRDINKKFKKIALYIKSYTITKCIDTKIYDNRRLFRVPNTINSKTGLYKVYIPYNKLFKKQPDGCTKAMTYDELKEYASSPKQKKIVLYKYNQKARAKFDKLVETIEQQERKKVDTKLAQEYIRKRKLLPCVEYVLQNGATNGQRNNTTVALANSLFQIGESLEDVRETITEWNNTKNEEPLPQSEINATVFSAYQNSRNNMFYGCSTFKDLDVCVKGCSINKK